MSDGVLTQLAESRLMSEEEVEKALGSEDFLKAIIINYSGCSLGDDLLKDFAFEAPNSRGYALPARMIGERLRENNCVITDAEALFEKAKEDTAILFRPYLSNDTQALLHFEYGI
ncbi:hypothetical protein [Vulcanisaeta sp. JCM 16161]|uniref:hypothetical protein n=1 Tax=Vulcanisaeta sp. JCM 16161 TaxID=1295372 RepID=UPI0006D2120A|nr:hypothetical protein [Vulcanisaeta sp. JCM 16161]